MQPVIICVDDEISVLDTIKEQLKINLQSDCRIEVLESGEEALELLEELIEEGVEVPLVIADQIMPGLKGDKLLEQVRLRLPKTLTILLTGQANVEDIGNAVNRANLYRYIGKPWDETDLVLTVKEAVRSYFQDKDIEKMNEELRKKVETFYKFVPVRFLEILGCKNFEDIELGLCSEYNLSVLFSDIRSFTKLSESITPQEIFRFLNEYLSHMGPIIQKNNGFIDKFIGDAIMGLFENADDAVKAGIEMLQYLNKYNQTLKTDGYSPLRIGIGVNTGNLMLGTIGESNRLETTVIGDVVNLASRIENLTKQYKTPLLISEYTFDKLKNPSQFSIHLIGQVKIKGKNIPVKVYKVV